MLKDSFKDIFDSLRHTLDQVEKNLGRVLIDTKTKPTVYATAASYLVNGERRLTSHVILARNETFAITKLKTMIAANVPSSSIEYISTIANPVGKSLLDRIKEDC